MEINIRRPGGWATEQYAISRQREIRNKGFEHICWSDSKTKLTLFSVPIRMVRKVRGTLPNIR